MVKQRKQTYLVIAVLALIAIAWAIGSFFGYQAALKKAQEQQNTANNETNKILPQLPTGVETQNNNINEGKNKVLPQIPKS